MHTPLRFLAPVFIVGLTAIGGCGDDGSSRSSRADDTSTTTTPTASSEPDAPRILFEVTSIKAVSNGPSAPSVAELPAATITSIVTYHWNDAKGVPPGTVSLRSADGTVYGPFPTTGLPGQGGVPNAFWEAKPDLELPAGTYTVEDSDPATWSWAPDTDGRGMVTIYGR